VSGRTLSFVDDPAHAPAADPATDIVVLDTSWTPGPGDRPDVVSVRPVLTSVLRRADVIDGSLALLDAWAESARLADRFVADDVTWWYRVRMMVRWDIHELMLWRLVLDELGPPDGYEEIVVPPSRPALAAAARATGRTSSPPRVRVSGTGPDGPGRRVGSIRRLALRLDRPRLRPWLRRARDIVRWRPSVARRDALLAARIAKAHGYPSSDYRAVIAELKKKQITGEAILPLYDGRLHQIEGIIRAHQLVTLPDRPAIIRLATPAETAQQPAPHMSPPPFLHNTGQRGEFVLPLNAPATAGAAADR
jgi:hypothetical protein